MCECVYMLCVRTYGSRFVCVHARVCVYVAVIEQVLHVCICVKGEAVLRFLVC